MNLIDKEGEMAQPSKEPCKKEACDIQACLSKNNFSPTRYSSNLQSMFYFVMILHFLI